MLPVFCFQGLEFIDLFYQFLIKFLIKKTGKILY